MRIVLLGPPGSGKGTQAKLISERYKIPHIAMGDIFRAIAKKKTDMGRRVKSLIDSGFFVPDDITAEILKKRLRKNDCKNGFILDGFPRNLKQAKILNKIAHVDNVIYLDVPSGIVIKRLSSRWQCRRCGMLYGSGAKPAKKGRCNKCSAKLYQRADDKKSTIIKRMKIFVRETKPLINYYKGACVLKRINGSMKPDAVFRQIKRVLG